MLTGRETGASADNVSVVEMYVAKVYAKVGEFESRCQSVIGRCHGRAKSFSRESL